MHLIFDFETMGAKSYQCPALDVSMYLFDWDRFASDNPYTFLEIVEGSTTFKIDYKDQMQNYGYKHTKDDVAFWASQEKEVRAKIVPKPDDLKIADFASKVIDFVKDTKIEYWWSRSNMFDPVILERIMNDTGHGSAFMQHLKFWKVRDTRTFMDAKSSFSISDKFTPVSDTEWWEKNFKAHDSRHDIAADIMRMQSMVRLENDMEMTNR